MIDNRAMDLLREGIAAARAGDKRRTRQLLTECTALEPNNEIAWLWFAGVADTPAEALGFLERVLRINPRNERAVAGVKTVRLQAGIAAAKAQDRAGARILLRKALADDPKSEMGWLWLAGATDDPAEAIDHLKRVLALNPANERAKAGIDYYTAKMNKATPLWRCPFCGAEASAKPTKCGTCKAILMPSQIDLNLFNPDVDRDKIKSAVMRLTMQLRTKPDYGSNFHLGVACLNQGRLEEAITHFTAALRFRPDDESLALLLHQLEQRKHTPDRQAIHVSGLPPARTQLHTGTPMPPPPRPVPPPKTAEPVDFFKSVSAAAPPVKASSDPGKRTILVVDDSPTIRKLVAMTMARNGYRVVEAGDGNEAVTRMGEGGVPDLVLLDINMPGMDGYTLCKLIRGKPETAKVPVIMLSGKDGFYNKIRGKMAGSTLYLTKPFQPDALLKVVQKYCPADGAAGTA